MWLTSWVDWEGEATVVHARGEIDAFTSGSLGQCFRRAMTDSRGRVILDLNEVTFIDGAGLRVLDQFHQDCRDRGLSLDLTPPPAHIRRLLEVVGLDRLLSTLGSSSERHAATGPAAGRLPERDAGAGPPCKPGQ